MHIKFLAHSKGSGRAAIKYLLGEKDHKGEVREDIKVLRGNPQQVGQLIDSLDFVNRYSSSVIAFHPDDKPTNAEIDAVLDDFERIAFAGLEANQYSWAAVMHEEKDGSKHVHVIAPRVELTSGRAMNIAPPGWQKTYDPIRDYHNALNGWARPDDPRLERVLQPDKLRLKDNDAREQITEWLVERVISGHVNNREDVLQALAELGEINRKGKDYISIRLETDQKPIRLKGALYDEKFSGDALRASTEKNLGRPRGRERADPARARDAQKQLDEAVKRISGYNKRRYAISAIRDTRNREADSPKIERSNDIANTRELVNIGRAGVVGGGLELVSAGRDGSKVGSERARTTISRVGAGEHKTTDRQVHSRILRDGGGQEGLQGEVNDGIREFAHRAIERAQRIARETIERIAAATKRAAEANRSILEAFGRNNNAIRNTDERLSKHGHQFDRFNGNSREINTLAEAAERKIIEKRKAKEIGKNSGHEIS